MSDETQVDVWVANRDATDKARALWALGQITASVRALAGEDDIHTGQVVLPISDTAMRAVLRAGGTLNVCLYRGTLFGWEGRDAAIDNSTIIVNGVRIQAQGEARAATAAESAELDARAVAS